MTSKTIALSGAEIRADYSGGTNAWLRNDGTTTVYASTMPGVTAGADGVVSIPAGQAAAIYGACGSVYLLGTGSVQLVGSDYTACPFKTSAQSGGSGADSVARAAIEAHAADADIHVTADEKAGWNGLSNPNLLINPDFEINQRGGGVYSSAGYTVDHWLMSIIGSGNSGSYDAETRVLSGSVLDKNGYYVNMFQYIENPVRFAGKIMTVSAGMSELDQPALIQIWRTEGTTTTGVAATPYNMEPNKVLTFEMPSDLTETSKIRVVLQTRGSVKLGWAKLELSGVATPFVLPDPATELLKCQRYYFKYPAVKYGALGIALAQTATAAKATLFLPAVMRNLPTVSVDMGSIELYDGTNSHAVTDVSISLNSSNCETLLLTSRDLEAGKSYFFRATDDTGLCFSAEL